MWARTLLLLFVLLWPVAGGCRREESRDTAGEGLDRVALALNWFPEAEHGGYFAADVHGFFEQEGVAVQILPGGPGAPVIQQVATHRVAFAIGSADQVLLGRDQGAPVVAVLAAMQESPRCIMVHEETGIRSLLEMKNLTLAVGSGKPFAQFLLSKLGAARLTIVPYQGNVAAFLQREDFAQQAYVFSEPHIVRRQGAHPRCLMLSEIGFNPYDGVLITSERLIAERPQLVAQVVRAAVRGWQKYLEEPTATNGRIHALNAEMGLDTLAFGAEALRALCAPTGDAASTFGSMTAQRWETLASQLHSIGLVENRDVWRTAFDARFLP